MPTSTPPAGPFSVVPTAHIERLHDLFDTDLSFARIRPVDLASILHSAIYDEALDREAWRNQSYSLCVILGEIESVVMDILSAAARRADR